MKDQKDDSEVDRPRRRNVMKSVLSGMAISLGGGSILSGDGQAARASNEYDEVDFAAETSDTHSYSAPDNIYATQYKTQIGGTFGYRLSAKNSLGNWSHRFGASLDAKCFARDDSRSDWESYDAVKEMQIKLMETGDSGNNPSLKPPSGGFKVGASPNPDYDSEPDYTDAAYTLLKSVITEVNPAANAADIASNVLSAAQSAPSETYNNTETYTWKYGSGSTQEKANAFCFWEISDPKSDTAECNVTLRAYDGTNYNTWAQLTTDIIVHSGDDNSGEIPEPSPWPTQETLTSDQATKEPPVPDDHVIEKSHTEAHRSKGMESPTTVSAEELPERNSLEQGQSDREITIMRFPVESRVRAYAGYVE